ncbi:hypothetical protein [Antarctobacter jejuensis]|uniref:hypothetical protein n=1 Tax=Antarctobacter jejuensis TaxID=1439938 RepID=UPI003FD53803
MKSFAAALLIMIPALAWAAPQNTNTPADTIHPNIHSKVGGGDALNANPNGVTPNGGQIHGIANNPGKSGSRPNEDGVRGQANELGTMHGGIGSKNKNVD